MMQVLLALSDAGDGIASRDELLERCWSGRIVGDDAITRVIASLRRILAQTGSGIGIETIPKLGYRLVPAMTADAGGASEETAATAAVSGSVSRRNILVGAIAVSAGTMGITIWRKRQRPDDVEALLRQGRLALDGRVPGNDDQGIGFLREAVARSPDDAAAWGLLALAYTHRAEVAAPSAISGSVAAASHTAQRALALDARQGEALAARALLLPAFGDWVQAEARLRAVLSAAPQQRDALDGLGGIWFGTGRLREGAEIASDLMAREPLSPVYQYRAAYRIWATSGHAQANLVLDRALELWPTYPALLYARFLLFAFTGQQHVALGMLRPSAEAPPLIDPRWMGAWEQVLISLTDNGDRRAAADAARQSTRSGMGACTNALLCLAALGDHDSWFDVADAYFLHRGPLVGGLYQGAARHALNDQRWRKTMSMFIPATAAVRADARFLPLCEAIRMTDYWDQTGINPDFLLPA